MDILTSSDLDTFFGTTDSTIGRGNTESGYILFYQKVDKSELDLFNFDIGTLDIRNRIYKFKAGAQDFFSFKGQFHEEKSE